MIKVHRAASGNSKEVLDAFKDSFGLVLYNTLPTDARALEARLYLDPKQFRGEVRWTNQYKGEPITWVESYMFILDDKGQIKPLTVDRMEEFTLSTTRQWRFVDNSYHKVKTWIKQKLILLKLLLKAP